MASYNTQGDTPAMPAHVEDAIMRVIPARVRRWIQDDAPFSVALADVYRAWRAGMSEDQMLYELRTAQRVSTAQVYGRARPQAAYSTAA